MISSGLIRVVAARWLVARGSSSVPPEPQPDTCRAISVDGQPGRCRVFPTPALGSRPTTPVVVPLCDPVSGELEANAAAWCFLNGLLPSA